MNPVVNTEVNRSWADFTQSSMLLKNIAAITQPVIFLYGSNDIRSSWPIEQIANLVKDSHFIMIQGADHYPWMTHADTIKGITSFLNEKFGFFSPKEFLCRFLLLVFLFLENKIYHV
jgi:proline iminopeptidase